LQAAAAQKRFPSASSSLMHILFSNAAIFGGSNVANPLQRFQWGRENMTYWWQKARDLLLDTEGDYVFEVSK